MNRIIYALRDDADFVIFDAELIQSPEPIIYLTSWCDWEPIALADVVLQDTGQGFFRALHDGEPYTAQQVLCGETPATVRRLDQT
ncbi:MAG: hypothetical protein F4Z82_02880 [Caldilineaceae bacterium SB0668_bin_21]|nr:hypothetical protein [Caldilineaceae bacterium SB0668_bin_21]MXX24380.1 hypothetical protein [Caldilineaceae bacterium SB0668_bin_21]